MIVVRVELHSAQTGVKTEIARMHISNTGGSETIGNYKCATLRGRGAQSLAAGVHQREGKVLGHPRQSQHVWHLVAKALSGMGYGARK